jgi:hypothetical protein
MRAHLLKGLLAERDIDVELATTSADGQRFLARLGSESRLLSTHFGIEFDDRHNMSRSRTERRLLRYLVSPGRLAADRRCIERWASDFDLVVNDSLHPALMTAERDIKVVHVVGENLRAAALDNFRGRSRSVHIAYRWGLEKLLSRSFAQVTHSLGAKPGGPVDSRDAVLPPLTPVPQRSRALVRGMLGVASGQTLITAYLNPHFRDPQIARSLEEAARKRNMALYGVSECFADRPGWVACDADLVDKVAAAEVFVSGAGMGALGLARTLGKPYLALAGDQPEQRANLDQIQTAREIARIDLRSGLPSAREISAAIGLVEGCGQSPLQGAERIAAIRSEWVETFVSILARARSLSHSTAKGIANDIKCKQQRTPIRSGPRDQQPSRWAS